MQFVNVGANTGLMFPTSATTSPSCAVASRLICADPPATRSAIGYSIGYIEALPESGLPIQATPHRTSLARSARFELTTF